MHVMCYGEQSCANEWDANLSNCTDINQPLLYLLHNNRAGLEISQSSYRNGSAILLNTLLWIALKSVFKNSQ